MSDVSYKNDFDNAINHLWKEENPIPDEYPRYSNFTKLFMELEAKKNGDLQRRKQYFYKHNLQLVSKPR